MPPTPTLLKTFFTIVFATALSLTAAFGQPDAPAAVADLRALTDKIMVKLRAGQRTAEALAPELAEFDALRAKYRGQKDAAAARIAYMQASLCSDVLGDHDNARALVTEIKNEFAGTPEAARMDAALEQLDRAAAAQKAKQGVIGKAAPALDFTWSTRDGVKSLSDLKGKVVVLDFWATWCGPCISSFPQVRELAAHYEGLDVVVLGVTSIQGFVANLGSSRIDTKDDPKREMALMHDFIKAKNVTWPIVFSEQPVFNEAYGVSGIPHMAIVAPDGTVRHNGLHPASPHAEKVEKIDALLKEFGKKTKA